MRKIIPYNPDLVPFAKNLRNNMTMGEIALWRETCLPAGRQVKNKKLGVSFSRQLPIDQYIVDFYCKNLQLAIEVDGSIHFEDGQQEKDASRQKHLENLGVHFVRFNDLDVKDNLNWVLSQIKEKIEELKNPPLTPPRRGTIP